MGHRALVLYRLGDDLFSPHYAHWGANGLALADRITVDTPLGGDNSDLAPGYLGEFMSAVADATDADDGDITDNTPDDHDPAVNPSPIDDPVTMAEAMHRTLDEAAFESVFVVEQVVEDGEKRLDVTGFVIEGDLDGHAILFEPRTRLDGGYHSPKYLSGWIRGAADALSGLVEDDLLTDAEANDRLLDQVLDRFADGLNKRVFAHSPAIVERHMDQHPEAFITFGGRTRVLGQMYPENIRDVEPWEIPATFPDVKTASGDRVSLP